MTSGRGCLCWLLVPTDQSGEGIDLESPEKGQHRFGLCPSAVDNDGATIAQQNDIAGALRYIHEADFQGASRDLLEFIPRYRRRFRRRR